MSEGGYFRRAARLVFRDGTWWWRALVVGAIGLVPYVGLFVVMGYHMVLMRDAAWGVDRGLPRFSERGEILRRTGDGLVVSLVWGLVLAVPLALVIVAWVFVNISHLGTGFDPGLPWWFAYAIWVPSAALGAVSTVALLRSAIYRSTSAGLSLKGVVSLIRSSPQAFREVTVILVSTSALALLVGVPVTYVQHASQLPSALFTYGWGFTAAAIFAPLWFVVYTAYGLWAKATDPATWPPLGQSVDAHAGPPVTGGSDIKPTVVDAPFDDV